MFEACDMWRKQWKFTCEQNMYESQFWSICNFGKVFILKKSLIYLYYCQNIIKFIFLNFYLKYHSNHHNFHYKKIEMMIDV